MMSKREYCIAFAKEDCRRLKNGEPSLSKAILDFENDSIADVCKAIRAKCKSQDWPHLRTYDAWNRRATSARLSSLKSIMDTHLSVDTIDVVDNAHNKISQVLCDDRKEEESASSSRVSPGDKDTLSGISIGRPSKHYSWADEVEADDLQKDDTCVVDDTQTPQAADELGSTVSNKDDNASSVSRAQGRSIVSRTSNVHPSTPRVHTPRFDAYSAVGRASDMNDVSAYRGRKVDGEDVKSTISARRSEAQSVVGSTVSRSKSGARSEVSVRNVPDSSSSHVSIRHVVSLGNATLPDTEEGINTWYNASVSELEKKHESGMLRQEQFKRKRAMLRVEYWTKLDKLRNNGTPTVIGR